MSYYKIENQKKILIPDDKILANMGSYLIIQPIAGDAIAERIDNFVYEEDGETPEINLPMGTEFNSMEPENRFNMDAPAKNVKKNIFSMGIRSITASNVIPKQNSGYITKEIEIGNVSYIELSVERSNTDTSVEFYIIDGQKEIPILPIEETKIKNEKIFYGQNTRFTPLSKNDVTIRLDGTEVSTLPLDELINSDTSAGKNYTVDYIPAGNPHKYSPQNTKIKIKMVERIIGNQLPSTIYSIVIKKYGADRTWNI